MNEQVKYGDIYSADLSPIVGSEQGGVRPVIVISNNIGNKYGPTVITAAITSRHKSHIPTHVRIPRMPGLPKYSTIMLEQIRTLDKQRLIEHLGRIEEATIMEQIEEAIHISLNRHMAI